MDARDIRKAYLDFQKSNKHSIIPRANLVPQDDPTTLFTGSGMQPLIQYLLGAEHPEGNRLADSQTCLRAEDVDEVGDNRHTTFFEMLGNWSLGDYFKAEQLPWYFEFLTEKVGLDPEKLYATCFIGDEDSGIAKDEESASIWAAVFKKAGLSNESADIGNNENGAKLGMKKDQRIFYYDGTKNWWSRSGQPKNMPVGEPGGPDSEIFYRFDSIKHDPSYGKNCHPNCECGQFMEIGNSVFMEYIATDRGFEPLPKKNVDFGGGLERMAAAALDDPDMFKISIMWPIIEKVVEISGKSYEGNQEAMRVIADHLRAATWLGIDGIAPSNKEQGYVMRRMTRRAVLKGHNLGIDNQLCERLVPIVLDIYDDFSEAKERRDEVIALLSKEESVFRQTLRKGVRVFTKEVQGKLTGEIIFMLHDTYGFPTELSLEQAKQLDIEVDAKWRVEFDKQMKQQRQRSRTATKGQFKGGLGGHGEIHKKYHSATHLTYKALKMVLGDHVLQRGSNITKERLRFDFEHPQKMTDEEKAEVEKIVNDAISESLDVSFEEIPTSEAQKMGALGAFGDKYGDKVKVYTMKKDGKPFSFEICGGPHVDNTKELGEGGKRYKIIKEESSSAGVRRVKAVLK